MLTADDILDVIAREVPGPRHTVGVDVGQHHLGGFPMSSPYLNLWCSCGWRAHQISISDDPDAATVAFDDIPTEVLEEAARLWRFHVRLSNRIYGIDKRLRRDAYRARIAQEEE